MPASHTRRALVTAVGVRASPPRPRTPPPRTKCPGALDIAHRRHRRRRGGHGRLPGQRASAPSRGLRPLRRDADLAQAARKHARDMVRRDYFSHVSPGGATLGDRLRAAGYGRGQGWRAGEALGWGTGSRGDAQRARSTSGSTARRTAASCSIRATASSASESRPASRATTSPSLPGATYALDFGSDPH